MQRLRILALADRFASKRELTDGEIERSELGALLLAEHLHLIRAFLTKRD